MSRFKINDGESAPYMMRRTWLIFLSTLIFCTTAYAQNRTANWVFGDSLIINFTESGPVVLPEKSAMQAHEAAACISDTSGVLLFYSNNMGIWNRNHMPLMNSDGINSVVIPNGSSKTNGCLFLPFPGDTTDTKFWVFITDHTDNKLRYSLIDRTLDGGLGGIVEEQKNLVLWNSPIGEQLTAVKHGNGRDWWLILRKGYPNSSKILSIHISADGILGGGEYDAGFVANQVGEFASSPNGETLAFASGGEVGDAILAIYNFDRCEGEVQFRELVEFDSLNKGLYGMIFSLSGNMLYTSSFTFGKDKYYQINLEIDSLIVQEIYRFNFPGVPTIGNMTGQFELGPDGKIYISRRFISALSGIASYGKYLGVIQYPDEIGAACQFDTFGVYLGGYVNSNTYSLPNFANYELGPLIGSPCDTLSPPQDTTQTGLYHPSIPTWSVNPTASSGMYTLTGPESGWLVVHDLYGREVLRQWHQEWTTCDLTAQPAGLYLVYLRAADDSRSLPRKIVRH